MSRFRPALTLLFLVLVTAAVGPGLAGPDPGDKAAPRPVDPAVREVLERMERAQAQVTSFRANVVETRTLALLEKPEILHGRLSLASPGKIRWEYRDPEARTYVLSDGQITGWIPAKNRVERMNVERREARLRRMFAIGQGADAVLRDFEVTRAAKPSLPKSEELVLVPESRRMRKRVAEIRMWIDTDIDLPKKVLLLTGGGDSVEFALSSIEVNPVLAAEVFTVTIPKGAEEVKGLSGFSIFGAATDDANGEM